MNRTQRVLAVVAAGEGGWFNYAPNNGIAGSPGTVGQDWREALIWLGAFVIWANIGYRWLRTPRSEEGPGSSHR